MNEEELEEFRKRIRDFQKALKFEFPKIEFPIFELPTFELPKFEFPKIEIPNLKIDSQQLKKITDANSKVGWTLTSEMILVDYFRKDLLDTTQVEKDSYFFTYYNQNNSEHFNRMEIEILNSIGTKWTEIIQDCFDSYRNDKYKLIIPTLFTIIEGEIAVILGKDKVKKAQKKEIEELAKQQEDESKEIAIYSLFHSIDDALFKDKGFEYPREKLISRHRVLHGKDETELWEKVDALRLFNVISSIQYVKKILKDLP